MCGIAGLVRFGRAEHDDLALVESLSAALAHRGPDAAASYRSRDGAALLVHRRLAIIDLTAAANQPMRSPDGRFTIVFNGEIYNFRELRTELETRGELFRTESDTEVLLRLVALDGPAALGRARGMFAFAVWDEQERTLLIARDRFGIKPLYLVRQRDGVAFSSEIAALRRANLADRTISAAGVLAYLSWASIPAPLTWLEGVEQLEPGTWLRVSPAGLTRGRFAHVPAMFATDGHAPPAEPEFRERVAQALRDTVAAHFVADVPVGVFLSGGIDSGAIVSLARSVTSGDLRTYTVVVDEAGYCEEDLARQVADRFGTTHHVLRVDGSHVADDLPRIIERLDQPTADAINSYYVSRAVASTGVKAVLSGVGGDELFGGYPSFERLPAGMRLARLLGPALPLTRPAAAIALPAWRAAKWAHFAGRPTIDAAYRAQRGFFMPHELRAIAGPALQDQFRAATESLEQAEAGGLAPAGPESATASVARLETCGFLRSQLLRDIDAVSMAHSLEVRVPLVDHRLLGATWPTLGAYPQLLQNKRLLHESLDTPLPFSNVSRPKQGFTLPFQQWMQARLRDVTRDGLSELARQRWITAVAAEQVWSAWQRGDAHWSRPWGLGILGHFLREAR